MTFEPETLNTQARALKSQIIV